MASKSTSKSAARRPGTEPGGKGPGGGTKGASGAKGPGGGTAKQRARAAKAVAAARADRARRNRLIVTVSVCVVLVAVVIGAVIFANYQNDKAKNAVIKAQTISANYPVRIDNGTILAGKDSAPTKIDVYEDLLCPYCGQLEQDNGKEMQKDLNNGSLQIRYRIVDTLNTNSNPPGYSQRAANATFASVQSGKFASYHWSLFHDQPEEQGPGYSNSQLTSLADRLGIPTGGAFGKAVKSGKYNSFPDQQAKKLLSDKSLVGPDGRVGTPTVVSGGKVVDSTKPGWLSTLITSNS
ncbi:MAG: thioredoxin domain-containing protein [Actinocatenispora sp.]